MVNHSRLPATRCKITRQEQTLLKRIEAETLMYIKLLILTWFVLTKTTQTLPSFNCLSSLQYISMVLDRAKIPSRSSETESVAPVYCSSLRRSCLSCKNFYTSPLIKVARSFATKDLVSMLLFVRFIVSLLFSSLLVFRKSIWLSALTETNEERLKSGDLTDF